MSPPRELLTAADLSDPAFDVERHVLDALVAEVNARLVREDEAEVRDILYGKPGGTVPTGVIYASDTPETAPNEG